MKEIQECAICGRELGTENISKHHLLPKSEGGKESDTVLIHNICHQKIHSLFTIKELRDDFHSVEKLITNEEMIKFIKWIAKKSSSYYRSNRLANRRKR